jgi:hypothetical protein
LLALERFRNLIKTNISAGAALYTDHKPGLFEESLSNKGQLSAWKIAETVDLQSIVEHHYRQGSKMLLADPLSRICAPSSGFYDPSLPSKFQALCKYLPESIRNIKTIRLYANKDTAAFSRHVQAWRKPTNPISQGRLGSSEFSDNSTVFFISVCHAEKSLDEVKGLLASNRQFAVLLPTDLLSEISRGENIQGKGLYDQEVEGQIYNLSKIVLSQEGDTWLVRINDQPKIVEVLVAEDVGCDVPDAIDILAESIEELMLQISILPDWHEHNFEVHQHREVQLEETIPQPRVLRSSRLKRPRVSTETSVKPKIGPIKKTIVEVSTDPDENGAVQPIKIDHKSSNFNKFGVDPIKSWIGKQLKDQTISQSILSNVIKTHDNYPDGLLAIPSTKGGSPRIIVPVEVQEN